MDLETGFVQVAVALFSAGTVAGTLAQVVRVAELTVENCDGAGVLAVDRDGDVQSVATSNALAAAIDAAQLAAGEGPGLDAPTLGHSLVAADLAEEERWTSFAAEATTLGVRSVLAYPLSAERSSSLMLWAHLPSAFGATERAQGELIATLARLALDSAEDRALDEVRTENLTKALRTRELIGQAQGILMERERITADQAFDILRKASQRLNVKLREVAELLVETGEAPRLEGQDQAPHG